ncbi:hypothetical protein CDCA_CDCA13G3703 [Cyanidium caldarium]|uniref:tRNA (guanine(26)-N(2))-dimethyltransferase n=1 Tax=Cyanidium caldarium TaxID=2771 RepID=A0AAV9J0W9_CYACA|nr:hypothetical protein CDCA_CDCA13G3703 [Cyanidium caldarium]
MVDTPNNPYGVHDWHGRHAHRVMLPLLPPVRWNGDVKRLFSVQRAAAAAAAFVPEWCAEGLARFLLPQGAGFYRSESRPVRDMGVMAALVHAERRRRQLCVCDALAGPTAVRALRYRLEGQCRRVLANDALSGEGASLLERNAAGAPGIEVRHENLEVLLRDEGLWRQFDMVDLDAFGTCVEWLRGGVMRLLDTDRGESLLYACSTAGVTAAGRNPAGAARAYGVPVSWNPAVREQGLRLLVTAMQREAHAMGLSLRPLFSHFHCPGGTFRVMAAVSRADRRRRAVEPQRSWRHVVYCTACGYTGGYPAGDNARGDVVAEVHACPDCGNDESSSLKCSGPMYLGPLHDAAFLRGMERVTNEAPRKHFDTSTLRALYDMRVEAEYDGAPFYYAVGDLGRRANCPPPAPRRLVQWLRRRNRAEGTGQSWRSSPCSVDPAAVRTLAPMPVLLEGVKEVSRGRA